MFVRKLACGWLVTVALSLPVLAAPSEAPSEKITGKVAETKSPVLWKEPKDLTSRNLFYGPGGKAHQPHGTFVFVKEDLDGTNPKFVIRDQDGTKWKLKMGNEARPETVASRITWAVGYYANEDYFMRDMVIQGMPDHLHRGGKQVGPDGSVHDVRLKRDEGKKTGEWDWRSGPFAGTRELNGLRVVMALINNWDLKNVNNAIYQDGSDSIYMVSDLGASFGSASRSWPKDKSKGNVDSYQHSKFLGKVADGEVNFHTPGRPSLIYLVNPKEYFQRIHMESIGKNIPREDVRWIGQLLGRLSPAQIRDAFRAGGYSPREIEVFSTILEKRIRLLTDL